MEIDKKIIKKLVETLEELKKSIKGENIIDINNQAEEEKTYVFRFAMCFRF